VLFPELIKLLAKIFQNFFKGDAMTGNEAFGFLSYIYAKIRL